MSFVNDVEFKQEQELYFIIFEFTSHQLIFTIDTSLEKLIKYVPDTCAMIIIVIHRFKLSINTIEKKCNMIRFRIVPQW